MAGDSNGIKHKDDGCHLHDSCLNCPEPICIYDFPGYKKNWERFKIVVDLFEQGLSIEYIMIETGYSKKDIVRYLGLVYLPVLA